MHLSHSKNLNGKCDDDSALFLQAKEKIFTIKGHKDNFKITDLEDLNSFKKLKKCLYCKVKRG